MTLAELAAVERPTLNDRAVLAYAKVDEITVLLNGPGPRTEGQRAILGRVLAGLASAQSDLDRLERMSREDRS